MFSQSFLERCAGLAVCTWSDALDQMHIGAVLEGITQRSGTGRFAGRAVTVKEIVGDLGAYPKGDFAVGRLCDAVQPGDVLVVEMGGAAVSTIGGNAAWALKRGGAAAAVIDGGCRDLAEIDKTGLWVASRHLTPITGKTRVKVEALGVQVVVGGAIINSGDLIIGDDSGIVVVPAMRSSEVLETAELCARIDEKLESGLRAGMSFGDAAREANYL